MAAVVWAIQGSAGEKLGGSHVLLRGGAGARWLPAVSAGRQGPGLPCAAAAEGVVSTEQPEK